MKETKTYGDYMKTIGLIGGMSWESSAEYYKIINETVKKRLGGLHSATLIMYSVDFEDIEKLQHAGEWDKATEFMVDAAQKVERGGADFVLICTNTMHKMADEVQQAISIPLLHIADATAAEIKAHNMKHVGLLGTRFTMEEDFYKRRLQEDHGLTTIVPEEDERTIVHDIIYDELCCGEIRESSREKYKIIIEHLIKRGAEGIILGCTEIPLLVSQKDSPVPVFDTTRIHAEAAVTLALTD
jgi:aspartate racemase